MNETYVTLRGWLGGEVRHRLAGETPVAEFRLGVTPRYFDKQRSDWVDADTQWFTVKAWRQLADHCRDSLRRADPVLVHGRLSQRSYVKDGVERVVVEVTARERRPRPVPRHQRIPPQTWPSARRWRPARPREPLEGTAATSRAVSRPVRTVRKASSSASHRPHDQLGGHLVHGRAEPAVRRSRPSAGRDVDQDAAHQGKQDADHHAADQHQDRQVDAKVGRHRVVAQRARGREREGPAHRRGARPGSAATAAAADRARPDRDPGDAQVGAGDLGVEPVGHVADAARVEARRTASAQGRVIPADTSSASARTSLSTWARCTGVASGIDVRALRPVSFLCSAAPRSRCSRRSGSGLQP